ncbi:MAG: M23 family metallopeptidase [Bacilli bacterium]|nr:M23 family metallopeptidase [Bacilli bacterium]MDD4411329.1 M23 family metallopeptidase [Bacilli bacterium]
MNHRRKLKPFVVPMLYSIAFLAFLVSIFFLRESLNTPVFDEEEDFIYVTKTIFDESVPVVNQSEIIFRPYKSSEIKIIKYFYDREDEIGKQQESILYYENTYMQNSGVDYGGVEKFEVVSILDGDVINVNEDNLLGNIIEIRHSNELISVYQSLSEVTIKQGDSVKQGQTIGKSGTSNISADLKDHLHFEVLFNGKVIDPESIYDKTVKDL